MKFKVNIIGLGEIGNEVFREMHKIARITEDEILGTDIDLKKVVNFTEEGYDVGAATYLGCDVYIVAAYTTEQVINIVCSVDCSKNPLIVIESTILPGTCEKLLQYKKDNNKQFDLVLFPHRFNPNDAEHHVFNLDRVIGAENDTVLKRATDFYEVYMDMEKLHPVSLEIAELTKPLENAYRYIEIAFAEELKMLCQRKGIDFEQLRHAANTKWNIDIKEAREGIGLKCLPKDIDLIEKYFGDNEFFYMAQHVDKTYRKSLGQKL